MPKSMWSDADEATINDFFKIDKKYKIIVELRLEIPINPLVDPLPESCDRAGYHTTVPVVCYFSETSLKSGYHYTYPLLQAGTIRI